MTTLAPKVPFLGQMVVLYGATIQPSPAVVTNIRPVTAAPMAGPGDTFEAAGPVTFLVDLHVCSGTGNPYKVVGVPYVKTGTVTEPVAEGQFVCEAAPLVITTEIDVASLVTNLQPLVDAAVRAAYAELLETLERKDPPTL